MVADDSGLMRLMISDILNAESDIEVVATAKDGKEAFELTLNEQPDIVILDMVMGRFDGLYAIRKIKARKNIPILILSTLGETNMEAIQEGLRLGATDYIPKPYRKVGQLRQSGNEIINKVRAIISGDIVAPPVKGINPRNREAINSFKGDYELLVIGASTGGPSAIEQILRCLPNDFPFPIIIVQHIPPNFVSSFVKRLNTLTDLPVIEAREGMQLTNEGVYIARADCNTVLLNEKERGFVFQYTDKVFESYNKPSIDAMFLSVAECFGERSIGVLLTGMGSDGAKGLLEINQKGGLTIAQDKESSAVWGMPSRAISYGAVNEILSLNDIPSYIVRNI